MLNCDNCGSWIHGGCVNLTLEEVTNMIKTNEKYFCPSCSQPTASRSHVCPICSHSYSSESTLWSHINHDHASRSIFPRLWTPLAWLTPMTPPPSMNLQPATPWGRTWTREYLYLLTSQCQKPKSKQLFHTSPEDPVRVDHSYDLNTFMTPSVATQSLPLGNASWS